MIGPLVSIIVPCFNVADVIEYALMSIEAQTYKNYEIILVDDGSDDNTESVITRSKASMPITYVKLKKNRGLSAALNIGLSKARGQYFARFDADDYMLPWRLMDQVSFFEESPEVELLGGGAKLFGASDGEHHQRWYHREIIDEFLLNNPFIHPTVMFRRQLFDRGLYMYSEDLRNEEDYELWAKLLPQIHSRNLPYPIIRYRLHSANNHRSPGRKQAKKRALRIYLTAFGIENEMLVDALAEYQCSRYFSPTGYEVVRKYAIEAGRAGLPKLAWLQNWISKERSYKRFMEYSGPPI